MWALQRHLRAFTFTWCFSSVHGQRLPRACVLANLPLAFPLELWSRASRFAHCFMASLPGVALPSGSVMPASAYPELPRRYSVQRRPHPSKGAIVKQAISGVGLHTRHMPILGAQRGYVVQFMLRPTLVASHRCSLHGRLPILLCLLFKICASCENYQDACMHSGMLVVFTEYILKPEFLFFFHGFR